MDSLAGQFLIAMPGMGDPRFERSVVYLCAHGPEGAMGLIVNKPALDLRFADLLDQLGIPRPDRGLRDIRVHFGGPVEGGRGFVLHSSDWATEGGTLRVDDRVSMTATLDILRRIAEGGGPRDSMLALGYAGWGPGQLEDEIGRNAWLTGPARPEILWSRANEHKWNAALKAIGVDPLGLSSAAGRA
ncbi:YqgE/AlgH family protein [Rubellimicrobium sp. CFH 75288]|uniref:YqgE/AlgH family protein n=1 Tax=Rubellimicrobium sp. CFH 75288 TaxID=2697034 RepID=UPI001412C5BA|nr:YqgE/AlgH family protein [Rubellimicrobium sp. CFH 75288]NAZ37997.1 YqgE/AlgH family protein [Rubellimicrobium sp. CFH 75288]